MASDDNVTSPNVPSYGSTDTNPPVEVEAPSDSTGVVVESDLKDSAPNIKDGLPIALATMVSIVGPMLLVAYLTDQNGERVLQLRLNADTQLAMIALLVYFTIFYSFALWQGYSKIVNKELLASEDKDKDSVKRWFNKRDRTFGNMQEQSPMFLVSFVLYSLLLDPKDGAIKGFVYSFLLLLYPVVFGTPWVYGSTVPRYYMIFEMICKLALAKHPKDPRSLPFT